MHAFILAPGVWEGEGKITFSMAEDVLKFSMQWTVLPVEDEKIYFNQIIQIEGFADKMHNHFCLSALTSSGFDITLENSIVGKVVGKGILNSEVVAWEFRRQDQEFEGYEVYELREDGSYKMHAEFTAGDGLRTHVQGYIEKH